jgi:hypothetical protein
MAVSTIINNNLKLILYQYDLCRRPIADDAAIQTNTLVCIAEQLVLQFFSHSSHRNI